MEDTRNTKPPDIHDFCIIKPISRGAFGKVFLGCKKSNADVMYAIKVMKKTEMVNKNMVSQVVNERNALALTNCPFCVHLYYSLQTVTSVYLVMEYMVGGDLKSLLSVYGFFEEAMACFYIAEVCLALQYLHKHNITHRDLKPDNMLLSREGHVKLTDFGLSKVLIHGDLELSDFQNWTPNLCLRTPGQLLSLTSHLSFGSGNGKGGNSSYLDSTALMTAKSDISVTDTSALSGVMPFLSAEAISITSDLSSAYHSCSYCGSTQEQNNSSCANSPVSRRLLNRCCVLNTRGDRKRKYQSTSPNSRKTYVRTGLTGEMEILRVNASSPLKGVTFSTPVSAQKPSKVKVTRFELPKEALLNDDKENVVSPITTITTPKTPHTPYRTPKSVRRGQLNSDQRILGTPDYLAPELLLCKGHTCAVDWWALGVCFYEFVTGIPPFNDATPRQVFNNILERNIEWPTEDEALSNEIVHSIEQLLTADPDLRPKAAEVMKMKVFENTDWDNLLLAQPPFVPDPYDLTDTGYFQARNELLNFNISNFDLAGGGVNDECSASEEELKQDKEEVDTCESSDTVKYCGQSEPVSCYCSASHTDNISTDEHDSLRDSQASSQQVTQKQLHLSDSGADLTEEVSCGNTSWQKFWALNGERLIWESWITKYSAYINPEYLQTNQSHVEENQIIPDDKEDHFKYSFDSLSPRAQCSDCSLSLNINLLQVNETPQVKPSTTNEEVVEKNRVLIRNLSYSDSYDKLNRETEGWNPLSPVSNDCETEVERLLSSRCASHTGSSARTVDSMTNVTRLTVSSFDLSESSKTSDSFSSVSSIQSSITSTSSEDFEDPPDYEQQWNLLWSKHYEQEYLEHYKRFILASVGKVAAESTDDAAESINDFDIEDQFRDDEMTSLEIDKTTQPLNKPKESSPLTSRKRRQFRRKEKEKTLVLRNLRKIEETVVQDDTNMEGNLNLTRRKQDQHDMESELAEGSVEEVEKNNMEVDLTNVQAEKDAMVAMGIPLAFVTRKKQFLKNTKLPAYKKRSFEEDDLDQTSSNRIKAAFTLLGIEMHESTGKKFKGSFEYKMKHIRLQNRRLEFNQANENKLVQPKHIYFDDDGTVLPDNVVTTDEVTVQNSHQDELLEIIPTSSTENDLECIPEQVPIQQGESVSKKKKRKRKINLPAEIKENPSLKKFWHRRYSLFSKFDQGVKLDEESWFSVTPELVAQHTANRCKCNVIIDAFCGAGGNTIQFALTCSKVIAIDIDPKKIELARHNAEVYGVLDRIEFIIGDFFQLADNLQADIVFLSPPWGGVHYKMVHSYDLETLQPAPFSKLITAAQNISDNVVLFLPKNSNTYPLVLAAGPGGNVEIEQNFLGKRLIAITAYYGNVVMEKGNDSKSD